MCGPIKNGPTRSVGVERLKDGNIHMCFFSRSGYRPSINLPPSLGNLLLDITLNMFNFIPVSFGFFVNFRVRVRVSYRVSGSLT